MKKILGIVGVLGLLLYIGVPLFASNVAKSSSESSTQNTVANNNTQATTTPKEKRVMYITFDDGPSQYTGELLDVLKKHNAKVTFFLLDTEMKTYPDAVKRILSEGHSLGLHGVSHEKNAFYNGTQGPVGEMRQANETLKSIVGQGTQLVRTPYGSYPYLTKPQKQALYDESFIIWDWNIDSKDWSFRCPERTFYFTTKAINQSKKNPLVILFHDIKFTPSTMEMFLSWMDEKGYTSEALKPGMEPIMLGVHKKKTSPSPSATPSPSPATNKQSTDGPEVLKYKNNNQQ